MFIKEKTAYESRLSDWSSDVCSSDLLVERQTIGVRAAPDRHQHDIGFERFGVAAGRGLECQHGLLALHRGLGDLGLELEFHPLFLEDLVRFLADIAVHADRKRTRLNSSH